MPSIEEHVKKSLERTGREYREVHDWIDEKKLERHDIKKMLDFGRMFAEKYGEEGAKEYVQHIHEDLKARFRHLLQEVERLLSDTLSYFGIE